MDEIIPCISPFPEYDLHIHEDLSGLLWIGDGPTKNYEPHKATKLNAMLGIRLGQFDFVMEEPSVIYTSLPVDFKKTNPSMYYTVYALRSPSQKGSYLKYLENPYYKRANISNTFLLLYGLERFLLTDKCDKALDVILKMHEAFKNTDFGIECTDTIVNYAIYKRDGDILKNIDFSKYQRDWSQYLLCAYSLDLKVMPENIMKLAGYTFPNYRYIDGEKRLFKNFLARNLLNETGREYLIIKDFVPDINSIPLTDYQIFHNPSLKYEHRLKYPDLTKLPPLTLALKYLMWKTHEDVKKHLAEKRKKKQPVQEIRIESKVAEKLAAEALDV